MTFVKCRGMKVYSCKIYFWSDQPNIVEKLSQLKDIEAARRDVVVVLTAQLHSTKPILSFSAGSNIARGLSEICGD